MTINFIKQRLPPYGLQQQDVTQDIEISDDSKVFLAKAGIAAMAVEDGVIALFHCLNNARLLHADVPESASDDGDNKDQQEVLNNDGRLELDLDFGVVLERIRCSSPNNKLAVGELSGLLEEAESLVDLHEF